MATINEHVDNIQAAIAAARDDGYLLDWDFDLIEWWGDWGVSEVRLNLKQNRRDKDGIMRVHESANILTAGV